MTLEVSPALNVRMSIRVAGPHLDTTNNQDHAAKTPRRINTAARTQRDLFISYLNCSGGLFFEAALSRLRFAERRYSVLFHVHRHLHAAVIRAHEFERSRFRRCSPCHRLSLTPSKDDFLKRSLFGNDVVIGFIPVFELE